MNTQTFELRKPKTNNEPQEIDYITQAEANFRNSILKANDANIRWVKQSSLMVKDFNGNDVNVKNMQHSLRVDFPSSCEKDIDDYGTPFLAHCVQRESKCGCEIVGNGTIQFPLMIKHCYKHR